MEVAMELLRAVLDAKVGATVLVARRWCFPSIPSDMPMPAGDDANTKSRIS